MNKRIYYATVFIEFVPDSQLHQYQNIISLNGLSNAHIGQLLQAFINDSTKNLFFNEKDFSLIIDCFQLFCKYIESAGGFIENNGKWLCIHRLNRWDLPKGKLEKGETTEQAAIRECEEECGISDLQIRKPLASTWHIYNYKKGFALKQTFWFSMLSTFNGVLKPQVEEDILEAVWFTKAELEQKVFPATYFTIQQVIKEAWA